MATSAIKFRIESLSGQKGRLLETLYAEFPKSISAKQLMLRSGFNFHTEPVSSFISLCIAFQTLSDPVRAYGWIVDRTNGTPDGHYRLVPVS